MTPLLEVVPRDRVPSQEALKRRVRILKQTLGQHPIYLDVKKSDPCALTPTRVGARPILEVLIAEARDRDLRFMPVAWTNSSPRHLEIVANAADLAGQGVALRHNLASSVLPAGVSIEDLVGRRLVDLAVGPDDVDLLLDLGYLDPDAEPSSRWLARTIRQLARVGSWRSIVLVATSVPPGFGNGLVAQDSTRELPRREWALWKAVLQQVESPVAFGDYAVQNPTPPPDPPPVGPWANIRYTTADSLLVARGFDIRTVGPEQYATLSHRITSHAAFRGETYSYGDREIARWANSPAQPAHGFAEVDDWDYPEQSAGLAYWRGIGTSHHLEAVTQQLRERS